jgi:hypothetical protein
MKLLDVRGYLESDRWENPAYLKKKSHALLVTYTIPQAIDSWSSGGRDGRDHPLLDFNWRETRDSFMKDALKEPSSEPIMIATVSLVSAMSFGTVEVARW